jgi:hypothetical protein
MLLIIDYNYNAQLTLSPEIHNEPEIYHRI